MVKKVLLSGCVIVGLLSQNSFASNRIVLLCNLNLEYASESASERNTISTRVEITERDDFINIDFDNELLFLSTAKYEGFGGKERIVRNRSTSDKWQIFNKDYERDSTSGREVIIDRNAGTLAYEEVFSEKKRGKVVSVLRRNASGECSAVDMNKKKF